MKNLFVLILALLVLRFPNAQNKPSTIRESKKVFTTYGFSDPNPIAEAGRIYPYFRFDGYTNTPAQKEWKIVEMENDYIKVMVLPEIGGKIWAAWEKSTGKPFIYYNQVVKFRDVAMRGPWTSGGIEANYGIIGHTPNCATPMDYLTETKPDGSVSCYIGTLDLLTQTYWTIEINLSKDKAYFTTHSFWSNATPLEQPYYTWMNTGMKSAGNLEFIYAGNRYLGHSGEYSDWEINPENGKNISFYENNNFGGPKSYHVFGKYTNFFGLFGDTILPLTYVNSTAAIKAFVGKNGGATVTSSNAQGMVSWALSQKERILFLPDQHLGRNTAFDLGIPLNEMAVWDPHKDELIYEGELEDLKVLLWKGHCSVHENFTTANIETLRAEQPEMNIIVHPECRREVVALSDYAGSTSYIINMIEKAEPGSSWAIGTEMNLVKRLIANNPDKNIISLNPNMCPCLTMNRIDLPHLLWALESIEEGIIINPIKVEKNIADNAILALNRMLERV